MGIMSLAGSFIAAVVMQNDVHAQDGDDGIVECKEFRLKDNKGKLRALMKVDNTSGDLLFTLLDQNEKARITQSVGNDGSSDMVLSDEKGRPRMSLTSGEDSGGAFSVFNKDGEAAAVLAVGKGNYPLLTLQGAKGRAIFGIEDSGNGLISLAEGDSRYFSVVGGPDQPSVMMIENEAGKGMLQLMADKDGIVQSSIKQGGELKYFIRAGKDEGTSMQIDNTSGSKVYIQAQKNGTALLQLNGGESYARAMSNSDGSAEIAIIKEKKYAWKATGENKK